MREYNIDHALMEQMFPPAKSKYKAGETVPAADMVVILTEQVQLLQEALTKEVHEHRKTAHAIKGMADDLAKKR